MSPSEDTGTNHASTNSDTNSSWHQLLIIGNGFDLECGLNSTFRDFFSTERESLIPARFLHEDAYLPILRPLRSEFNSNLTFWDLILKGQKKGNWCDIEAAILKQVLDIDSLLSNLTSTHESNSKGIVHYTYSSLNLFEAIYQHLLLHDSMTAISSKKSLSLFLLNELHRLESAFAEFLRKQAWGETADKYASNEERAETSYETYAKAKLHVLLSFALQSDDRRAHTYSILSFNYTGPFDISSNEIGQRIAYTNIHGLCREGEEIIFGIDGKENLFDEIARPFTKTYRLLSLGGPNTRDVVRPDTRCIKFYGHSLSDADYSYFQAIFDAVHLYSSDVSLVFFYRCFDEKDPLIHRSEMMNKVINLLTAYGATLENKDHGKNLVHKLLLEGRLSVQEIGFDSQSATDPS